MTTVHLDGQAFEARPGETVLALARRVGLGERVATLCFDPRLPPNGSCFLCIVEVEGVARLLPSCATPVSDGMKVTLRSERVVDARRIALELLLSNHDADCEGPCREGCPAGIDIQGYLKLVAQERFEEAWRLIRKNNPLVAVCGRVCVRRCEEVCRRELLEAPVGINHLKRVASEWVLENPVVDPPGPANGHRVAVVGAGPAGLTAAYFLRKMGTAVTIFESLPQAGGMLRYGIPSYRLPREVLDREIASITDMEVEVRYEVRVGVDVSLAELRGEFDAVFIAAGAPGSKKMRVEGESGPGVHHGIDLLRDLGLGCAPEFAGERIVVVGGGNTALDVARTATRMDAEAVRIVYRRTRKEMPAHEDEVVAAIDEGVEVDFLVAPVRCVHEQGPDGSPAKLVGLECIRMELGEPDSSGRRRPVPVEGSEHVIDCDMVVAAIGQDALLEGLGGDEGLPRLSRWGTFETDPRTGATSMAGVFAAGDDVTGPQAVIDAIGAARKAALAIQRYLEVGELSAPPVEFTSVRFGEVTRESLGEVAEARREPVPMLPLEERKGFAEVERPLPQAAAEREAARCLQCGCAAFEDCDLRRFASEYGADPARFAGDSPRRRVDTRHPWVLIDPNKCILCGRCVRTCAEVLGVSALGLVNRGFDTVVAPALGGSLQEAGCVSCGSCVEACPTGALSFRGMDGGRFPATAGAETVCGFCGVGCAIEAQLHGREVVVRSVRRRSDRTYSDLCARGRFGHTVLGLGAERITTPLVRRDGELRAASFEEAVERTAAGLAAARDSFGAQAVGLTCSPRLPSEDTLAVSLLGREVLGTPNVASLELTLQRSESPPPAGAFGGSTIGPDEVARADVILLVGSDPSNLRPVAALAVRRAVQRGAKLIVLGSGNTPLVESARIWLNARRGAATIALSALAAGIAEVHGWPARDNSEALREGLRQLTPEYLARTVGVAPDKLAAAVELLLTPGAEVAVVADLDDALERSPDLLAALGNLLLLLSHGGGDPGRYLLVAHANAVGARATGLTGEDELRAALGGDRLKAAWLVGEDPLHVEALKHLADGLRFLAVAEHTLTETARQADVVFPLANHLEAGGTFVSASGVARSLRRLMDPPGGRTVADLMAAVGAELGHPSAVAGREELTARLANDFGMRDGERMRPLPPPPDQPPKFTVPSLDVRPSSAPPPSLLVNERRAAGRILSKVGRRGPRI